MELAGLHTWREHANAASRARLATYKRLKRLYRAEYDRILDEERFARGLPAASSEACAGCVITQQEMRRMSGWSS